MSYRAIDADEIEDENQGRAKRVRTALGVTAFGINQFQIPPGARGSDHDESDTGQEEVYFILSGNGLMHVDGETVELKPGRYVFVPPGTRRQVEAGAEGLSWICVGSQPGRGYTPRQ